MMPDPEKVKVVQEWPNPHDVLSVRQFLGPLASYYQRYVNAFAKIAAPLHSLTHKDTPLQLVMSLHMPVETSKVRTAIQCDTEGVPSRSICSEAVSTLLVGLQLQNYNGSCTTPMVVCTENGRFTVPLGIGNTRI